MVRLGVTAAIGGILSNRLFSPFLPGFENDLPGHGDLAIADHK
jgi:hypothetical protein